MIKESKDDITPQICTSLFTGNPCQKEGCNCLHLTDFQITINDVLSFNDLFYVKEQESSRSSVKVNLSEREREIVNLAKQPVLCDICSRPIDANNSFYFECCNVYTCTACSENWKFTNCCPSCGKYYEELQRVPAENIDEIEKDNAPLLAAKIIQFE